MVKSVQTSNPILYNACNGKSKSRGGMNLGEFRETLKNLYPKSIDAINNADTRKKLEALCLKLMEGKEVPVPKVNRSSFKYKELPKKYCEDYNLDELTQEAGRGVKLTSKQRYKICKELNIPKYKVEKSESLGYNRDIIIEIVRKISEGDNLDEREKRIVNRWNEMHDPIKERLDNLAEKYVSGERLNSEELEYLDEHLFSKYCRCVLKRKKSDEKLFKERNIGKILDKLPVREREKARSLVNMELGNRDWNNLDNLEKDRILSKIMQLFLGLSIGGCKSSVYIRTRKIKPRNHKCDYELDTAEIALQNFKK